MENAILLTIAIAFVYFIIYKKNELIGNLSFFLIGMIIFAISEISNAIGFFIVGVSLASLVYDLVYALPSKSRY